jgi:hypothetical protein
MSIFIVIFNQKFGGAGMYLLHEDIIFFTRFIGEKLCYLKRVFLVFWAATSTPKILPKKVLNFFFLWYRSISTWKALIYLMLVCEVNNMRNFVFWAIMASFEKNII